jgi:hypothetical protein
VVLDVRGVIWRIATEPAYKTALGLGPDANLIFDSPNGIVILYHSGYFYALLLGMRRKIFRADFRLSQYFSASRASNRRPRNPESSTKTKRRPIMTMRILLVVLTAVLSTSAFAEAKYSLSCNMRGSTANVYACNSGNSAEGNNEYVTVEACTDDNDCDNTYELMYIYASSGRCEIVGSIDFVEAKDFCIAQFRE